MDGDDINSSTEDGALDLELAQLAFGARKPVQYLEKTFDAVKALDRSITAKDLEVALLAPESSDQNANSPNELLEVYRSGDETKLTALAVQGLDRRLLANRNLAWMKPLKSIFATGGSFVAVGAGHLLGEDGLIRLLEAQGFSVRRIVDCQTLLQ